MTTAFITGITGQDGTYLAQLLLSKGYKVYGSYRGDTPTTWRLKEKGILDKITLSKLDLSDQSDIITSFELIKPDEVYNFASESFIGEINGPPDEIANIDALGALRLLEAIRQVNPKIRFYQASSSEMFGKVENSPQDETTPFYPRTPYGISKVFAHWTVVNYRESYGIHASSGICFNHESPLRSLKFLTRKITHGLVNLREGNIDHLEIGNLNISRDWGFAGDYVRGMWQMLQQPIGGDYVLATGRTTSVRRFIDMTADCLDYPLKWEGVNLDEHAIDATGRMVIFINQKFWRPREPELRYGNYDKVKRELGWSPEVQIQDLIKMMVQEELRKINIR